MAEAAVEDRNKIYRLEGDFCATSCLQVEKVIDKAICGDIVLANRNGYQFAVKKFTLLDKEEKILAKNKWTFYNEVKFMQSLNHPFVMKCAIAGECPEYMAICMDYYRRGTLQDYVGHVGPNLMEFCFTQVACALRYLHKNRIVHLDVKLDNIFLDSNFNAILGDFGHTMKLEPQQTTLPKRLCGGTDIYFSPEHKGADSDNELDPYKLDSYCLGVVLWALAMAKYPDDDICYYNEAKNSQDLPVNIRKWLLRLLERRPSKRLTVTNFLKRLRLEGAYYRYVVDRY